MSFAREEDSWVARDEPYRRRSPGRRPRDNRNRSRSPQNIDRYQPGRSRGGGGPYDRRDDQYRRRSPPPIPQGNIDRYVPGLEPPAPVVNPLPNPLTLNYQVGFNWFAEWWRKDQEVKEDKERQKRGDRRPPNRLKGEQEAREEKEKEREKIQTAYDDYKLKLQAQMGREFVANHKDQEWFKERYDPEVRDPLRRRQAEFRREQYSQWQSDVDNGLFDEFSLEGIYKNDSNGAGGVVEKEEGEAAAATEVLGVGDLVPLKGGDLRDDALDQSALLIKTIAPYVSREQLESFCKEHLGEGEGGFKWLSLSDPNFMKKCHRIGWVMLNPGGDQVVEVPKEDRGDGRDEEEDGVDGDDNMETGQPETITKSATTVALEEINGKSIEDSTKGNFTCHVGVHVPSTSTRKKALWDLFSAPERVERDLELVMRLVTKLESELGEDINAVNKVEERVEEIRSKGLLQPTTNGASSKPHKQEEEDGEADEEGEMDDEEEGAWDEESDDEELLGKKKKLDLLVEYLRRVHNFCFFCVFESDSVHELSRKCAGGHLRRPRATLTSSAKAVAKASAYGEQFPLKRQDGGDAEMTEEGSTGQHKRFNKGNKTHQQLQRAFNWVKTYEDKLYQILEPDSVDIKKLGGKPLDEGLEEELKKFIKQEDESKFRCKVPECTKLFKGESFWRKHVEKRHPEWFDSIKKGIQLINNYVLDPAHISPTRNDATSATHFPPNGMLPTGTPRGFNLAGVGMTGPMGYPVPMGMPPPGSFPPSFGQYPVTLPGAMGGPYPFGGMNPMPGQVGPMRRGGGRYGARTGNPYDRQPGAARGLTTARGGIMGGGPRGLPRFADATAAGNAMGPKEAVQGRSLKSYEDLDAVGGGGEGELDY